MFDDHIRKQGGDEYVIRSAVRVHGGMGEWKRVMHSLLQHESLAG